MITLALSGRILLIVKRFDPYLAIIKIELDKRLGMIFFV